MAYLNLGENMRLIYDFKKEMETKRKKEFIEEVRALSLNQDNPFGIKKDKGLFASDEWWHSVDCGKIITETISGTILSLYEAGMEIRRVPNSFRFVDSSGAIRDESMYMNSKSDRRLFAVGKEIMIFYAYDELKKSTQRPGVPLDLENNYVGQVIEMAISK